VTVGKVLAEVPVGIVLKSNALLRCRKIVPNSCYNRCFMLDLLSLIVTR